MSATRASPQPIRDYAYFVFAACDSQIRRACSGQARGSRVARSSVDVDSLVAVVEHVALVGCAVGFLRRALDDAQADRALLPALNQLDQAELGLGLDDGDGRLG